MRFVCLRVDALILELFRWLKRDGIFFDAKPA
jgi:hypothetical protein